MNLSASAAYPLQKEKLMPYDEVMDKWKEGKLKSGSTGEPVTSHDQAVAIMLSEKRKAQQGRKEYAAKKKTRGQHLKAVAQGKP